MIWCWLRIKKQEQARGEEGGWYRRMQLCFTSVTLLTPQSRGADGNILYASTTSNSDHKIGAQIEREVNEAYDQVSENK